MNIKTPFFNNISGGIYSPFDRDYKFPTDDRVDNVWDDTDTWDDTGTWEDYQ